VTLVAFCCPKFNETELETMNYRDIRDQIRSRHGSWDSDRYEREIENDGHSLYDSVYSRSSAVDGCRDYENERHAQEAYDDIRYEQRREEEREEEERDSRRRQHDHDMECQRQAEYERQEAEYLERQEQEEEQMPQEEITELENNSEKAD
jgi:hypothetical protein